MAKLFEVRDEVLGGRSELRHAGVYRYGNAPRTRVLSVPGRIRDRRYTWFEIAVFSYRRDLCTSAASPDRKIMSAPSCVPMVNGGATAKGIGDQDPLPFFDVARKNDE